ncbi:hypothetical protein R1sor_005291 [Riccia sorocarpa]|uniref:RPA43 OB domain-containing protein n=1 Tax=Riccia sorocarpa TaxID=122646 RepID=A0ABD3HNH8_9MARC
MEGLAVVHAKIGVFFPPSRAANVKQGVHEIRIGIRILAGLTPYFHVNLTAKLLIFSPSPGMLLEGKVNKVEKDYIGVVVLVLFNAAIGVICTTMEAPMAENGESSRRYVKRCAHLKWHPAF